jgi:hypothetical protein
MKRLRQVVSEREKTEAFYNVSRLLREIIAEWLSKEAK